jgi:hypothetical protein
VHRKRVHEYTSYDHLTVSKLIEILQKMPGDSMQATRETEVYDDSEQRTLTDAQFCADKQDARQAVCLRLK